MGGLRKEEDFLVEIILETRVAPKISAIRRLLVLRAEFRIQVTASRLRSSGASRTVRGAQRPRPEAWAIFIAG
jgi:hypothetical protein